MSTAAKTRSTGVAFMWEERQVKPGEEPNPVIAAELAAVGQAVDEMKERAKLLPDPKIDDEVLVDFTMYGSPGVQQWRTVMNDSPNFSSPKLRFHVRVVDGSVNTIAISKDDILDVRPYGAAAAG